MLWKLYSYLNYMTFGLHPGQSNSFHIPFFYLCDVYISILIFTSRYTFFYLTSSYTSWNLHAFLTSSISHRTYIRITCFSLSHTPLRLCYVCFYITCELIFALHVYFFHLSTFISVTLVPLTRLYFHSYCDCVCPPFAPFMFSVCFLSDSLAIFWANPVIPQVKIFILEQTIRPHALQSRRSATRCLRLSQPQAFLSSVCHLQLHTFKLFVSPDE